MVLEALPPLKFEKKYFIPQKVFLCKKQMRSGYHKVAYFYEGQCNALGLRDRWIEETFAYQKGLDAEYQLVQTPNKAHVLTVP